jgi:hypothetical protein
MDRVSGVILASVLYFGKSIEISANNNKQVAIDNVYRVELVVMKCEARQEASTHLKFT